MSQARKALLDLVSGKITDVEPPKAVPRQFVEDFETVAEHYGLKHIGEYLIAKDAARSDLENAITTYAALAEEIKQQEAAA